MEEKVVPIDEEELGAAEDAAKGAKDTFTLKLSKPLMYNGISYSELTFDFDGLSGKDSLAVENELARKGIQLLIPAFNGEYIIRVAARACTTKIGSDAIEMLSIRDYNKLRSRVRNFLMSAEQ